MLVAQIDFKILEKIDGDAQNSAIYEFLAVLLHDGRIGHGYPIVKNDSAITAFVTTATDDAFTNFEDGENIPKQLKKLDEVKLSQPKFRILGEEPDSDEICRCENSTAYILFTSALSNRVTPLFCFDCFTAIPLYRLPRPEKSDFYEIYIWQSDYRSCDSLQLHSRTGERFGLREMSDVNSSLSRAGLEICRELFELTGKRVYYYLHKYYGKSLKKEKQRKCPGCGGEWLLAEPLHRLFDFKCDKCHLLSNLAFSLR